MSAQTVDVLAVMDRAFGAANEHYDDLRTDNQDPALNDGFVWRRDRYAQEHRAARVAVTELLDAGRMSDAAIIHDPQTGVPLRVEVPLAVWQDFRAAWKRAGGAP